MDLLTFDQDLRAVAGQGAVRPFLCDGSPLTCPVFLVGINPATNNPLWPYWSTERGCDKQGWLRAYLQQKGALGKTRNRIERLVNALAPVRAIETNVFAHHSPSEVSLADEHRTTEVLDFLLERLAPRLVFAHGVSAIRHMQRLTGTRVELGAFVNVSYRGVAFETFGGKHLRFWSNTAIDDLGRIFQSRCVGVGS